MKQNIKRIIEQLASKIVHLKQPIHLLAVCTGGIMLAKTICLYLKKRNIKVDYYEIWTKTLSVKGKREICKTDFTKKDYNGTAVIVEDVIWRGGALPPIKKMLKKMNPKKQFYIIALLDCNHKADFAIFR